MKLYRVQSGLYY